MADPLDRLIDILERIAIALEREAGTVVSAIPPEGLSKEDAARFLGLDVPAIDHLIRTRRLSYCQYGTQRGRLIPLDSLRDFLKAYRQDALNGLPDRNGKS